MPPATLALITGLAALAIGWRLRRTNPDKPHRGLGCLFIILAGVCALALVATAAQAAPSNAADPRVYSPPERYTRGDASFTLHIMDIAVVARRCALSAGMPANRTALACTLYQAHRTDVIMPRMEQVSEDLWLKLLIHEMAHIRLWPSDHPQD